MPLRVYACLFAGLCAVLSATNAAAMSTPNPAGRWDPQRFILAGDFQFNGSKDLDHGGEVNNMAGFFVRPAFSIVRNVVVYGRLGFQTADQVDLGFAGGFGIQGAYEFPADRHWAVGGSFDYLHWSGDLADSHDIDWNEFQLTPAVSYAFEQFTPYAGLMLDFVDGHDSISQDDPVGLLFGTNWDPTPHLRLDAQVRVISETGFFVSFGYLF